MKITVAQGYGNDFVTTHKGAVVKKNEVSEYEKGSDFEMEQLITNGSVIIVKDNMPVGKIEPVSIEKKKPEVEEIKQPARDPQVIGDKTPEVQTPPVTGTQTAPVTKQESTEKSKGLTTGNVSHTS